MTGHQLKLVLLGEGRVGKTSLLARATRSTFDEGQQATLQAAFAQKVVEVDGQKVVLHIWDTAGQERYSSLGPIYYRGADAALLVFDITDADTLERVKGWVRELQTMVGPGIALSILANKQDLEGERAVPQGVSAAVAEGFGAAHYAVSAKTGQGVEAAIQATAERALAANRQRQAAERARAGGGGGGAPRGRRAGGVSIADDLPDTSAQQKCC